MSWTDVAMVGLTTVSVGASVWAVVVAAGSRSQSSTAVLTAKDANQISREANRLASESNQVAREAVDAARAAATDVAWDDLLVAVAAIQTLDPASSSEPVRPLLTEIRTRATLLVDRVEADGLGQWVPAEMQFGVLLMQEAAEKGQQAAHLTVEQALDIDAEFHTWVAGFTTNLRMFRRTGPQGKALSELTTLAKSKAKAVATRNGYPEPLDHIPGLAPLNIDD